MEVAVRFGARATVSRARLLLRAPRVIGSAAFAGSGALRLPAPTMARDRGVANVSSRARRGPAVVTWRPRYVEARTAACLVFAGGGAGLRAPARGIIGDPAVAHAHGIPWTGSAAGPRCVEVGDSRATPVGKGWKNQAPKAGPKGGDAALAFPACGADIPRRGPQGTGVPRCEAAWLAPGWRYIARSSYAPRAGALAQRKTPELSAPGFWDKCPAMTYSCMA